MNVIVEIASVVTTLPISRLVKICSDLWQLCWDKSIKKEQEKRAFVLQHLLDHYRNDKESWVKFAVNITNAYNQLLTNISVDGCREKALKLFVEEVVYRAINYIVDNGSDSLEMCFLHGKSKKEDAVDFHCNDGTIRKVILATVIDDAGIIIFGNTSPNYYSPTGSQPLYYRELFESERIDAKYTKVENPPISNGEYSRAMNPSECEALIATVLQTIDKKDKLDKALKILLEFMEKK